MPAGGGRLSASQRRDDILACGADFILCGQGSTMRRIARHLGISMNTLILHVPNVGELIRELCLLHLNKAFDAVCLPADWQGAPAEVLRAMGLALLHYAQDNASRHLVFILYRHTLDDPARNANDTLLIYLTNNFQLAIQAVQPGRGFDTLHGGARMLLGQIMFLPLWWVADTTMSKDEWLCHQIGQLADTGSPDWRVPAAQQRQAVLF